jgi:EmrB/QacA subfamily drug resistance transporter
MVILDLSIVNVALPSIQVSLGFSTTQLQWVVDAYAIVFAGFLMLCGRVGDHFGQRRTFVTALGLFGATSLLGGLSVDHQMLITARALQGFSGALMAATSLAIITSSFPPGPARHRAIGLWGAMNGAGGAVGTLAGGVLTQELSWRWILLINPPIAVVAAIIAHAVVTERKREKDAPKLDVPGAVTLTVGQVALVYGIVLAATDGWGSAAALVPMVLGAAVLVLFGLVETYWAPAPLVPFRSLTKPLQVANGIVFLFSFSLFSMWYVSSLYLQQVLGLSPLRTGFTFLPLALVIMVFASRAGKLVGHFGVRTVLGGGLVMMATGMALFARIGPTGSSWGYIVLPGVLMAAGIGLSIVPSTIFAVQGAGPAQAGLASGLVNTSRQAGGGLGLALLISLATSATTHEIGRNVGASQALTDGFRLAYLVGAGFVALAAVVTFMFVRVPAPQAVPGLAKPRHTLFAGAVGLALVCVVVVDFTAAGGAGAPIGTYTTNGAYSFVSAPNLHPPVVKAGTATKTSKLAPGYIMTASFYDLTTTPMIGQSGPLMMDNDLQPVWFKPLPTDVVASNLTAQQYKGKPVLTWWQGVVTDTGAVESGEDVIVNQHYQTVATLKGADGWVITLHELVVQGGDAWVTANKDMPMNLSRYGGASNGALDDSAVQEYSLATGKLLYSWDALDHIPLTQSKAQPPANGFPWDAYHVNSISLTSKGFIASMRNTWAAYNVDRATGKVLWQLGGKSSTFTLPAGLSLEWQHDVKSEGGDLISIFDDDCCELTGGGTYLAPAGPSKGLVLKLDTKAGTASVVAQYSHGAKFDSAYMGDIQLQPNGNVFIGWGSQPVFSEYTKSGQLLLDASFPYPDQTYRATLANWVGLPLTKPAGAARRSGTGTTVYASWNGATQLSSWRVLAGPSASQLKPVKTTAKTGFETKATVPGHDKVLELQALNAKGKVIGTSADF